ncbi:Uncharacterized protein dnm_057470 [Desulfonema magnum]|uniref:Uncharacterized protein n=1 Tax=Desulfonema magnum TaxID=45655 RepID=A0A975BQH1_9BACT|nr:Uncharacterized protein dnm_057470 [Desulfonema magnum]
MLRLFGKHPPDSPQREISGILLISDKAYKRNELICFPLFDSVVL